MTLKHQLSSVRHLRVGRFLFCLLPLTLSLACHRPDKPVQLLGQAQGSYYSIQYFDPLQRDLKPQIDSLLAAFDQSASLWIDSSLLRRLNANLTDSLDPVLDSLLLYSLYMHQYTGGAFDCRVGRLVQAWGFSFRERSEPDIPTLNRLRDAAQASVSIYNGRLVKANPDTELDFNAIAQGYASDLVGRLFDSLGIHSYLVDIGGEVVARGTKADGKPWIVGIERPAADSLSTPVVQTAIALRDAAVVTSGSYRKYYERDGLRYSHTLDPSTGRPVQHTLLSVSVADSSAWLADAMATAYMVMGLDRARQFIESHPNAPGTGAVYFIYDDHGTLKEYETDSFKELRIKGK